MKFKGLGFLLLSVIQDVEKTVIFCDFLSKNPFDDSLKQPTPHKIFPSPKKAAASNAQNESSKNCSGPLRASSRHCDNLHASGLHRVRIEKVKWAMFFQPKKKTDWCIPGSWIHGPWRGAHPHFLWLGSIIPYITYYNKSAGFQSLLKWMGYSTYTSDLSMFPLPIISPLVFPRLQGVKNHRSEIFVPGFFWFFAYRFEEFPDITGDTPVSST